MTVIRALRSTVSAPWNPRTRKTWTYLLLGPVVGALWFAWAVILYVSGAMSAIGLVGLPVQAYAHRSMRAIGKVERWTITQLLDTTIDEPESFVPRASTAPVSNPWVKSVARWDGPWIREFHPWRVVTWALARLTLGSVGFVLALAMVVVPASIVAYAVMYTGTRAGVWLVPWHDNWAHGDAPWFWSDWVYLYYPLAVVVTAAWAWLVRGFAALHVPIARWTLGPSPAERERRTTQRLQLAEERNRIDQELHDSIGHMITMTVIQAGAGAHVFDSDPEFVRQALRNIEERGRAAMGELDRIIATMRGDDPKALAPLPSLADILQLVEDSRNAGMIIHASITSPQVPAAVGRAAYAIVREALTNAAKHAPGASVNVVVAPDADALGISVSNSASSTRLSAATETRGLLSRNGIAGIRDRVTLLGGASRIGALNSGGYAVVALLPLGAELATVSEAETPWTSLRREADSANRHR